MFLLLGALVFGVQHWTDTPPGAASACEQLCINKCDANRQDCNYTCGQHCSLGTDPTEIERKVLDEEQHLLSNLWCWTSQFNKKGHVAHTHHGP